MAAGSCTSAAGSDAPPPHDAGLRGHPCDSWTGLRSSVLVAAAVVLTYLGSLDGGFVSDDVRGIRDNPLLRSLAPDNLAAIATGFDDANWIPLKVLSLAVDQHVFGPEPFGYHLTNLVLHVGCALLVLRILRVLGLSAGAALLTALLWALHPVQVESVAFMSERKNVLSAAFFLGAFLAWTRYARTRRARDWTLAALLFAGALLSKMNTVVLPALCLAYEWVAGDRLDRRRVVPTLPLFAVGALVVWINLAGSTVHGSTPWHGGSPVVTWLSSSTVVFRYLGLVIAPVALRSYYHVPLRGSPADPAVAAALAGLLLLTAVTLWLLWRRRREGFWLFWFGVTLAPMLNVVPFPALMQDRYLYLALLGLLAAPATALDRLRGLTPRRATAALATAAALACALLSVRQIETWHDPLSLWRAWAVADWYLPADRSGVRGPDSDAKLALLEAAAAAAPASVVARHNLGALRYERGDLPGARAELEAAARLDGAQGIVLLNLGRTLLRGGDPARAAAVLERAAALEPHVFWIHLNLARARLALGDRAGARTALDTAARTRPALRRLLEPEYRRLQAD